MSTPIHIDFTLKEGEGLMIQTPEALVSISALLHTMVTVWRDPEDNPVGFITVIRE